MTDALPQSVLFCCDHNAVRSPMAEGIMKKFIAVCAEMDVELARHRSRSFDEMEQWGDDLSSFDLIVALSPASQRRALELTRFFHLDVEYWPILDPTGLGETRDAKLVQFRAARDQITDRLIARFGPPLEPDA
jgi:protein-tyrosine-phosphatase